MNNEYINFIFYNMCEETSFAQDNTVYVYLFH